ncbi:hypothetical protein Bca4012_062919 [Brassica carinata]
MPCNNKVMGLLITIKATYHVPFETNTIRGIGSNVYSHYHIEIEDSRSSLLFCIIGDGLQRNWVLILQERNLT